MELQGKREEREKGGGGLLFCFLGVFTYFLLLRGLITYLPNKKISYIFLLSNLYIYYTFPLFIKITHINDYFTLNKLIK
ncbi:hypothetical protein HanHA300_Chr11g0398341 [Helianthus annuus]|nr:hypothetical protein HanHA300_Chr11g0398341 [Helianthus annuus]KAJ0517121.1 hypothetical protein HanHA89_Chr11g0421661 [Helianthus annuus]KAJ0685130.1 hypothetical protein HanLR1_Chr11g0399081 [Helianthus annuus]KAJ0689047.1 hypothetical protein HanOQP8_Chr11g0401181 [Helianthus annuus]